MYDTIYKRISYVKCVLLFLCRTHMSHDDKATKVVVSYVAVKGDNKMGYPLSLHSLPPLHLLLCATVRNFR